MGLKAEFDEAAEWVVTKLSWQQSHGTVSVFETTIRALGGLLAAHALSGHLGLLTKVKPPSCRLYSSALPCTGGIRRIVPTVTICLIFGGVVVGVVVSCWSRRWNWVISCW